MTKERIARINELAHKSKTVGLTEAEKTEQQALRKEYIEEMKSSLRAQLEHTSIKEPDGTIHKVSKKNYTGRKKSYKTAFSSFFVGKSVLYLYLSCCGLRRGAARQKTSFPRWRIPGKVHGKGCLLKNNKEVIYYAYCNYGYQLGR